MVNIRFTILTGIFDLLLSTIILKVYFDTFFDKKVRRGIKIKFYIPWILYFLWQGILVVGFSAPFYQKMLVSTALITFICFISYIGNIMSKLIFSILICTIWTMMEFIVGFFFSLFNIDYRIPQFAGVIISKVLALILIVSIQIVFNNENIQNLPKKYCALLLLIPVGSMYIICNLFMLSGNKIDGKSQIKASLFGLFIMMLINIIVFYMIVKLSKESELMRENTVYAKQLELCNVHMKEKESVMLEFRNERHDLNQHFIVLMRMLEMNETDKARQYLSKLVADTSYKKLGIARTDNIVVDALINAKYVYAQKNGIKFEVQINIPVQLPFENADISILLGNILDNAIEASVLIPEKQRHIELYMELNKNTLVIILKNNYNGNLLKDRNGKRITTKDNIREHGFGLKSVYRITDKYHGMVNIEETDTCFTINVLLHAIYEFWDKSY